MTFQNKGVGFFRSNVKLLGLINNYSFYLRSPDVVVMTVCVYNGPYWSVAEGAETLKDGGGGVLGLGGVHDDQSPGSLK